ncbi:MAG: sialate O-acetylesterase [Bacteroidetes bacterium]|nr:MAG: sialate O-acetylesterase [Bacteroidota bacterium]
MELRSKTEQMKKILPKILPAILILSCFNFQSFSQVTNQRVFDTVGFIPEHYPVRIALFEKESFSTGGIIFLGNSITEMGDWKKLTGDSTAVNRGIGGDITFGVLKRLDEIIRRQPRKLFILIGINDIGKDIPDAVIADNVRKIIERVQQESSKTTIYIHSILPVNPLVPNFPQHYDKQTQILSTNIKLKEIADSKNVVFINIHDQFLDEQQNLDKRYTVDGLHLNKSGYDMWIKYLRDNLFLP